LAVETESSPKPRGDSKVIRWYRSPIDQPTLKALYRRSDAKGFAQTLGYLGLLCVSASLAVFSAYHWPWWVTVALVFLHGTFFAFQINAVHELGHFTVFKTRSLNVFFEHVFAFLGWINHRLFFASHSRHHHSTLHPPDDLEVVVPIKINFRDFLRSGIVNVTGPYHAVKFLLRIARGQFQGEWELFLFPEDRPDLRKGPMAWSRTLLIGHSAILVGCLALHWWMVPVVFTFAPFYGSMLFYFCNNTQHVGMKDFSTDFRECCRTFELNPFVRFLYWHMNYHIEHHMYVGVPCYNLGRLHRLIEADLPPSPKGIIATWREIGAILERQKEDPTYVFTWTPPNSR
jgi:fatty acid desaturase